MKTVHIRDGLFYGKSVFGDFQYVSERAADANCKREMYISVVRFGKTISVHVNKGDFVMLDDNGTPEQEATAEEQAAIELANDEVLATKIKVQFEMMEELVELVVRGTISSLIVSGAAGIGKSYHLETRMKKAAKRGEIGKFTQKKGTISALFLYAELYNHRHPGDVLLLDDVDVWGCEKTLDILKGALDTGEKRTIDWSTASPWLDQNCIPRSFNFDGACVFLTNVDFDRQIERESNITPHLVALLGRSSYLDLAIHSNKSILIRIKQVIEGTTLLAKHGIGEEQKELMLEWLEIYYDQLRDLSIRTILKMASYMVGSPNKWIDLCEATMIKSKSI